MPTGYTCKIIDGDGITFREFALSCARAFGACVTMRDDPSDAPIPEEFKPYDYHVKALKKAEARLRELDGMTERQAESLAIAWYDEAEKARLARLRKTREEQRRYGAMLAQVQAWNPPTANHLGFKEFMLKQIRESMKFDDMTDYYEKPTERISGAAYLEREKQKSLDDVAYHTKEHAAEVERCASRTKWIQELRASLR